MRIDGVLLLAANTTRSRAYAQAMAACGIHIDNVLIFDREGAAQPGRPISNPPKANLPDLFVPDLGIPLEETCATMASEFFTAIPVHASIEVQIRSRS